MRGADQLDAAFRDRPRRRRFFFAADLVDDNDLWHVILDRFDHDAVLRASVRHLHATRATDARMRHVAVARDLVRGVDDDDAFAIFAEHARAFAQHRRLADARRSEETDRFAAADGVEDEVDRAVDRASRAACETDDGAAAIANRRDAVERLLDARTIVAAERADARDDVREFFVRRFVIAQNDEVVLEARFGRSPEIQNDFDDLFQVRQSNQRLPERQREDVEQLGQFPARRDGLGVNGQCTSSLNFRSACDALQIEFRRDR